MQRLILLGRVNSLLQPVAILPLQSLLIVLQLLMYHSALIIVKEVCNRFVSGKRVIFARDSIETERLLSLNWRASKSIV